MENTIEDAGICVSISSDISEDKLAIIKVDDYYAGLHEKVIPKAIDFLVIVDCECNTYAMYLLELKNVKGPKFLNLHDIQEKFANTIADFLSCRFKDIFLADKYKYRRILLYLVSDAYNIRGRYKNYDEYKRVMDKINKKDSLKIERNLSGKLYKFKGKILRIQYDIPPNPIIRKFN